MDLKKAYEILGVPENATKEEIDQKYFLWIKKSRGADFAQINQAYKLILSHLHGQNTTASDKSPVREKVDHFFYYYKFHLLAAIVILIIVISIANTISEKIREAHLPPAQVNIMLFGESQGVDIKKLENNILSVFPDWDRVAAQETALPPQSSGMYDMAILQKRGVILATDRSDIYLMDMNQFEQLSTQTFFYSLDELEQVLKSLPLDQRLYAQSEKDDEKHLYGINIGDNAVFKETGITPNQRILTIRIGAKNLENALELIRKLAVPPPA